MDVFMNAEYVGYTPNTGSASSSPPAATTGTGGATGGAANGPTGVLTPNTHPKNISFFSKYFQRFDHTVMPPVSQVTYY